MKFKCPTCDQHLEADENTARALVLCPRCRTELCVPDAHSEAVLTSTVVEHRSFRADELESDAMTGSIANERTRAVPPNVKWPEINPHRKQYGGIRRAEYFWGTLVATILLLVFEFAGRMLDMVLLWTVAPWIALLVLTVLASSRLQNIGMSAWWCLVMLVPIINLTVAIPCYVCQEGYRDTKKLDRAGKIAFAIIVTLLVVVIVRVALAFLL